MGLAVREASSAGARRGIVRLKVQLMELNYHVIETCRLSFIAVVQGSRVETLSWSQRWGFASMS